MDPIKFNCRICKKVTQGKVLPEYTESLPPGLVCLECLGCGVLGVELIADGI